MRKAKRIAMAGVLLGFCVGGIQAPYLLSSAKAMTHVPLRGGPGLAALAAAAIAQGATCSGYDETFNSLTVCNGIWLAGVGEGEGEGEDEGDLHFEYSATVYPSIVASYALEGAYDEGRVESYGNPEAASFRVLDESGWVFEQVSSGLFLAHGDTGGSLALGDSSGDIANQGATLQAFDPSTEDGPWARLHLEADDSGTTEAQFGVFNVVSEEEVFEGLLVEEDGADYDVIMGDPAGAGVRLDAQGNIVVSLGG